MPSSTAVQPLVDELAALGFSVEAGKSSVWVKCYGGAAYSVRVSVGDTLAQSTVDYGTLVKANRKSTLNFSQAESRVVFECMDRLLTQGYAPDTITLEKSYQVGHGDKYLDILVSNGSKAYMMIECKTWGAELAHAKSDMLAKGGQLVSYWLQDRDAKILCLYASRLHKGQIESDYSALDTNALSGSNLADVYASWDKYPFEAGLFNGAPYQPKERWLLVRDLKDMAANDGGKIFNAFAEILRRHVISDKPNAFNKIFNLFICKVQDEEKDEDDTRLDFQWLPDETAETVLNRLNDLYKKGLKDYLQMEVADHTQEEINARLVSLSPTDQAELRRMFTELRLYKNNEFAFLEVYDQKTFRQNAEIVKDVVRLLQGKRLRYTHRQPFMGEFFERLLNTSVKQESGQFFTPIPIARFICDSLPIEQIIDDKIAAKEPNFLPYIFDYAAGSGHFLTEGMDRIDEVLKAVDRNALNKSQKSNLTSWSNNYLWAKEFVYGIEKDYRLAKTAKVSCFLNGDGEANLIRGDGLDHFERSEEYSGILKKSSSAHGQNNPVFDVVVANPPYSVWQCKMTIKNGDESFSLWPKLSDKSDDIECLFAERTKQVLRPGGVAGVIFPSSILTNQGIEAAARDLLLKHFDIVAITMLGSMTFMKANVSTATLFMRRRPDHVWQAAEKFVAQFFDTWKDIAINGVPDAAAAYSEHAYGQSLSEYRLAFKTGDLNVGAVAAYKKDFAASLDTKAWHKSRSYKVLSSVEKHDQQNIRFVKFAVEREKVKLLHFVLACNQRTVLINAPGGVDEQKKFLGYEFKERMGYEGLWPIGETLDSALYDEGSKNNPNKVATIIRANFEGKGVLVPPALLGIVRVLRLVDLLDFRRSDFDCSIKTQVSVSITHNIPVQKLDVIAEFKGGLWQGKKAPFVDARILRNTEFQPDGKLNSLAGSVLPVEVGQLSTRFLDNEDILLEKSGGSDTQAVGRVGLYEGPSGDATFSNFVARVRVRDITKVRPRYLWAVLNHYYQQGHTMPLQKGMNGIRNLDMDAYKGLDIPVMATPDQDRIVRRLRRIETVASGRAAAIARARSNVEAAVWSALQTNPLVPIADHFTLNPTKREVATLGLKDSDLVSFLPMPAVSVDGLVLGNETRPLSAVKSGFTYFRNGDILFAKITPCMENRKGALVNNLSNGIGFGSTEFHVLRGNGGLDSKILFNLLQQERFRKLAEPHMTGMAGQRRVPKDYLSNFKISVPNSATQSDIVEKIDVAGSLIDKHKAGLVRLATTKQAYLTKTLGI